MIRYKPAIQPAAFPPEALAEMEVGWCGTDLLPFSGVHRIRVW
jgi:hypothetical protein